MPVIVFFRYLIVAGPENGTNAPTGHVRDGGGGITGGAGGLKSVVLVKGLSNFLYTASSITVLSTLGL